MTVEIRTCSSPEELRVALDAITHYFGRDTTPETATEFAQWIALERVHAAFDGDAIVGGAGAFSWRLSVPGGSVPAAGVTVVGVLPTHRRRGVLTQMMRAQLDDCRERGDVVAHLWASEPTIYGRFGYGLATRMGKMTLPAERTRFATPFDPRGSFRLVDLDTAAATLPALYDRMSEQRPGMASRDETWWRTRRLFDEPTRRHGGGPLNRVLLELEGEPAGYALYRVEQAWRNGISSGTVTVVEAVAPGPEGVRELWRWLLDFDWTSQFVADLLPVDHELVLLLAEARRMSFQVNDATWLRLVDIGAALAARAYTGDDAVVFEVRDAFCPWNEGRWRVANGEAERVDADADIALDVSALASAYLGAFTFAELARSSRVQELREGAIARADALFARSLAPWCAEIF